MANAGRWSRLLARVREALEPAPDHYEILDTGLARRMGGVLWLVGGLVALALLPFAPPQAPPGTAGWLVAGGLVATSLASGLALLGGRVGSAEQMLAMSIAAPVFVGLLQWLAGPSAPYTQLLVLSMLWSSSAHTPRRALALAVLAGGVALSPLLYGAARRCPRPAPRPRRPPPPPPPAAAPVRAAGGAAALLRGEPRAPARRPP